MEYRVTYEIDIDADDPVSAAREAYEMMSDPMSMLPILGVAPIVENEPDQDQATVVDLHLMGLGEDDEDDMEEE